jgi:ribose transport system permease protein
MGMDTKTEGPETQGEPVAGDNVSPKKRNVSIFDLLSVKKIGAVYVLIAISVVFSFVAPSTFPHWATVQQVLDGNSILALAAMALIVPLSAGVFDLSTAYTFSMTGVVTAYLMVHSGFSLLPAILVAMLAAICIGVINGIVVVTMGIDSFIGTLATGSLIVAAITAVSGDNEVTGAQLSGTFVAISQKVVAGFTLPVYYALGLAVVLWYLMSHTATGRRLYATGFNKNASRLAGLPADRLQFCALVSSSTIAGAAGIVFASSVDGGQPNGGTAYLLPAFAAVFLGATQLTPGRFNSWGTLIAVALLGVGITGLGLANEPEWSQSAFVGVVLIAALGITGAERRGQGATSLFSRSFRRRGPHVSAEAAEGSPEVMTVTEPD